MPPLPELKLAEGADADRAYEYLKLHDDRVKFIDMMSMRTLKQLYDAALEMRGMGCLTGGPDDHDSLVNYIIDLEFPDANKARQIRADAALEEARAEALRNPPAWQAQYVDVDRRPAIGQE